MLFERGIKKNHPDQMDFSSMEMRKRVFFNRWFLGMIGLGSIALGASLLAVHVFHLKPCIICKLQRIPFSLLIANGVFGLATFYKPGFFKVIQGCLILGVFFGMVHFLVQMGSLPDPCVSQRDFESSLEFSKMLTTSKCSDIAWSIFGVPVSLLNGMGHAVLFVLSLKGIRRMGLKEISV